MVFRAVFNGFHGCHTFLNIMKSQAMQITMEHTKAWHVNLFNPVRAVQHSGSEKMTKAWHAKGMEWHDEAWRGSDKLLQHQRTETGKIKKPPDGSAPDTLHQHSTTPVPINSMLMTHVSKINANIEVWGLGAGMGFVSSSAMCCHVVRPWRCNPCEICRCVLIIPVPRLGCYMATQHMKNDRYAHARQRQT